MTHWHCAFSPHYVCGSRVVCVCVWGGRGRKGCSPGYSNGQRRLLRRDKTDEALGRHGGLWSSADKNTPHSSVWQLAHTDELRRSESRENAELLNCYFHTSLHALVSLIVTWKHPMKLKCCLFFFIFLCPQRDVPPSASTVPSNCASHRLRTSPAASFPGLALSSLPGPWWVISQVKAKYIIHSTNVYAYSMFEKKATFTLKKEIFHASLPNHLIQLSIFKAHKGMVVVGYSLLNNVCRHVLSSCSVPFSHWRCFHVDMEAFVSLFKDVFSRCFSHRLRFPPTSSSWDVCSATGDVEEAESGQVCYRRQ